MWYYFGFLAISLAMLGIAASGLLVFLLPRVGAAGNLDVTLARSAALFAGGAILSVIFHLNVSFAGSSIGSVGFYVRLLGHVLVLTLPFFFGGLCLSLVLTRFHHQVSRLYFADLVGSGIGCLVFVSAITGHSGPAILFLVAALALFAAILFQGKPRRLWQVSLLLLAVGAFVANDRLGLIAIRAVKSYGRDQIQQAERTLAYEVWSPITRTSVFGPHAVRFGGQVVNRGYTVMNDAGAPTTIHGFSGKPDAMLYLARRPSKLHNYLAPGATLIIGAGGGCDVWAALATGATQVDAVELSPATVALVRGPLREFAGGVYDLPNVNVHVGEGRSFVRHSRRLFDSIELTMVDSWIGNAAGAFIFNENNLYTVEAVESYLEHLRDAGILAINRYYHYNEGLRVASTSIEALQRMGVRHPEQQIAITRGNSEPATATVYVFLRPIDPKLARRILSLTKSLNGTVIWSPHVPKEEMGQLHEDSVFRELLADPPGFLAGYVANVYPTTDDKPFFFYTNRGSAFGIDPNEHPARSLALPIVHGLFFVLVLVSVACLVLPLLWVRHRREGAARARMPPPMLLGYFACLGLAFMLVEVPLIQKFVLFLGHPTYSFTVVLASLLVFSGLGSLLSERLPLGRRPELLLVVLGLLIATQIGVLLSLDPLLHALLGLGLRTRILLTILILAPPGVLMGMPFPSGIRLLSWVSENGVPWAWAVNGVFSVLTTALALLLALNYGFRMTLAGGAVSYSVAALFMASSLGRIRRELPLES
jgi:hypothetical protein